MNPPTASVVATMIGAIVLGTRWRSMMRNFDAPRARAASPKSCWRRESTWQRTRRGPPPAGAVPSPPVSWPPASSGVPDPWVDLGVGDIRQQVEHDGHQRQEQQHSHGDVEVMAEDRLEEQQT